MKEKPVFNEDGLFYMEKLAPIRKPVGKSGTPSSNSRTAEFSKDGVVIKAELRLSVLGGR